MSLEEISNDSRKELKNNPNKSCEELLDERRAKNMRRSNIR